MLIDLVSFTDRDITAPQMLDQLDAAFVNFDANGATVLTAQLDNGPPSAQFPFGIRVFSEDTEELRFALSDIEQNMLNEHTAFAA